MGKGRVGEEGVGEEGVGWGGYYLSHSIAVSNCLVNNLGEVVPREQHGVHLDQVQFHSHNGLWKWTNSNCVTTSLPLAA